LPNWYLDEPDVRTHAKFHETFVIGSGDYEFYSPVATAFELFEQPATVRTSFRLKQNGISVKI
jgi:hypothetical protein